MAGYFHYLGRVFAEKGAWYKILTIGFLYLLMLMFSPEDSIKELVQNGGFNFNIPGLILCLLANILVLGYTFKMYADRMKNQENLLPAIDFADMFIRAVRFIPFGLVWTVYVALILFLVFRSFENTVVTAVVIVAAIIFLFVYSLTFVAVTILHAKDFSYKNVLNPLFPFKLFRKIGDQVLLAGIIQTAMLILLSFAFMGLGSLLGDSVFLICPFLQFVFTFAYNLTICDIVKTRLAGTEYLEEDFEVPAQIPESDVEVDE